jgi:hypothetical protein
VYTPIDKQRQAPFHIYFCYFMDFPPLDSDLPHLKDLVQLAKTNLNIAQYNIVRRMSLYDTQTPVVSDLCTQEPTLF